MLSPKSRLRQYAKLTPPAGRGNSRQKGKTMEINEVILKEWKAQADKDHNLEEYEYHLGSFPEPLPYQQWKLKYDLLNKLQAREDYKEGIPNDSLDRQVNALCAELGY